MFKALLTTAALFLSGQALSQTTPPDVGTYTPRSATYAAGTTPNIIGDGSNAKGGTAPAFSTVPEPSDPSPTVPTGWIVSNGVSYCTTTNTVGGACNNKKARFSANSTHFLYDDPIRNWGQPGAAHCHEFFGNAEVNAYSTRRSLRTRLKSSAAGGPANLTGYWEPCLTKLINGKLYAIPSDVNIVYYDEEVPAAPIVDALQSLHLLLRFVAGTNMDDPDDALVRAEIDAANAQPGTFSGRYSYAGNGFHGYQCSLPNGSTAITSDGKTESKSFRTGPANLDASDPWYVNGVHTCVDGSEIIAYGDAPDCWDGWNVWSPGGYKHLRYSIRDSIIGTLTCPNGWYKIPFFVLKTFHRTHGWDDYKTWGLASDAMMSARLAALGTPRTVLPGESFHFDWMNGWNTSTLSKWLSFCMGIGSNAPHGCDYSTISATERLISDSPAPDGSRNPQVNLNNNVDTNDPSKLKLVETTRQPTHDMKGM